MPSVDPSPVQRELLERNPSFWIIVPTLALLSGQALAAVSLVLPVFSLTLFVIPLLFLFRRDKRVLALFLAVAGVAFGLGYVRHRQLLQPEFSPNHLRSIMEEGSLLYLEGHLPYEPEKLPQRSRWVVRSERIWHPTGAEQITGDLLISVRQTRREWHYGDRIRFRARPLIPRDNGNPGGFDYPSFLARREIYATASLQNDDEVELLARSSSGFWQVIEYLRREIRRFIESEFSPQNGALMKALVVGDMGGISKEVRADFTAAGVNHVLSISGLHVGMLGLVIFFGVRFFGSLNSYLLLRWNLLKIATFLSFLAVLFYTALAGGMIPTVRSAIMIGIYELAVLLDREEEVFGSLALAALLIGLVWPGAVMDISFQLSFLAVLFIVWGSRKLTQGWPVRQQNQLPQERKWWQRRMRQVILYLAVPILATIGTGPMIALYFGHLSLAGFFSNPFIVPLVGFVIVPLGLLVGFLSLLAPGLALPFIWLAEPLLSLAHAVVRYLSLLPLANIGVPIPNLLEVVLLYLFILSVLVVRRRSHLVFLLAAVSVAIIGDGLYWRQERWNRKELRVTHLSVGHGDAAVVEFPGSKVLVIDAGGTATGDFDTGEAIIAPFLRSRKILKVDYLFVSHPRVDHYGGMKTIVEEFAPSEFWSGPGKGITVRYQEMEEMVEGSAAKRIFLSSRDPCRLIDGVRLCVLYPPEDKSGDSSVVVRLSFGQADLLFGSDIEGRDEKALLLRQAALASVVLKVPRHGSLSSSTEEFIEKVKPKLAVFSVGQRNPFGLPREEVLGRYSQAGAVILRTDRDGAIIVETDGRQLRYWTHRGGKKGSLALNLDNAAG